MKKLCKGPEVAMSSEYLREQEDQYDRNTDSRGEQEMV